MIFNDAVVNDRNIALHIRMRMGVQVAGLAMGGPAGVPNAQRARQGMLRQPLTKVVQAPLCLGHAKLSRLHDRHARAVIPAIFQVRQAVQQNVLRIFRTNVANDAAHAVEFLLKNNTY